MDGVERNHLLLLYRYNRNNSMIFLNF